MSDLLIFVNGLVLGGFTSAWVLTLSVLLRTRKQAD